MVAATRAVGTCILRRIEKFVVQSTVAKHFIFRSLLNLSKATAVLKQYLLCPVMSGFFALNSGPVNVCSSSNRGRHAWCHVLATVNGFSPLSQADFPKHHLLREGIWGKFFPVNARLEQRTLH